MSVEMDNPDEPFTPPRHVIDLSLPAQERYQTLAVRYRTQLQALTALFDDLLLSLALPASWLSAVNKISKFVLRKVHDSEQTKELMGISRATEIPMYLLVAFNVVLDLLMGCTSGAVMSLEPGQPRTQRKMLHFRTLDWTMDPLRKVIVQLDFVKSKSTQPDRILASSITYLGFVGVLTGVRQGLSMSLNFRAIHNAKTKSAHFRFYFHHLLVLLGRRPSIASMLRHYLMDASAKDSADARTPASIALDLRSRHTTAAYIILSDGSTTVTMEKDYATAKIQSSSTFIAITNHDKENHQDDTHMTPTIDVMKAAPVRQRVGLDDLIEESTDRLQCIERKWNAKVESARGSTRTTRSLRSQQAGDMACVHVSKRELIDWVCEWPTSNECTHYAAVLDPLAGNTAWAMAYPQPLEDPNRDFQ